MLKALLIGVSIQMHLHWQQYPTLAVICASTENLKIKSMQSIKGYQCDGKKQLLLLIHFERNLHYGVAVVN